MTNRPSRRSIHYLPSWISLAILPVLVIYHANKEITAREKRVIKLYLADSVFIKKNAVSFAAYQDVFPPKRNYTTLEITGNITANAILFAYGLVTERELLATHDTTTGIYFRLNKEATYGNFVTAIDICLRTDAKTYAAEGDNIWIYNLPDKPPAIEEIPILLC